MGARRAWVLAISSGALAGALLVFAACKTELDLEPLGDGALDASSTSDESFCGSHLDATLCEDFEDAQAFGSQWSQPRGLKRETDLVDDGVGAGISQLLTDSGGCSYNDLSDAVLHSGTHATLSARVRPSATSAQGGQNAIMTVVSHNRSNGDFAIFLTQGSSLTQLHLQTHYGQASQVDDMFFPSQGLPFETWSTVTFDLTSNDGLTIVISFGTVVVRTLTKADQPNLAEASMADGVDISVGLFCSLSRGEARYDDVLFQLQ